MTQLDLLAQRPTRQRRAPSTRKRARPTQLDLVRECLEQGGWWTSYEVGEYVLREHGRKMSDSSVTARLRDLKNVCGLKVERRFRTGKPFKEYRLAPEPRA